MTKATLKMISIAAQNLAETAAAAADADVVTDNEISVIRRSWLNVKNACRVLARSKKK